jgi:hypothetical protein
VLTRGRLQTNHEGHDYVQLLKNSVPSVGMRSVSGRPVELALGDSCAFHRAERSRKWASAVGNAEGCSVDSDARGSGP